MFCFDNASPEKSCFVIWFVLFHCAFELLGKSSYLQLGDE